MINNLILATANVATDAAATMNVEGLIRDLAIILILAAITTVLFKWLKQPVVLGYIVAGFLASPHFEYLPTVTTVQNIDFWAQIGIVVLLFSLGIEFSFKKLMNAGGSAVVTAFVIICGMSTLGWGIGKLMGMSDINSIFLGGMISMSSTTIIIKALTDLNLRHKKFASQVLAVLIVEDLFAVLMMVILSSIAINKTVEGGELLYSVGKLVFFLVMWFIVGVYVLPSLLNSIRRYLNNETLLVVAMGLCLGMAVFSVATGFSLALGAFVMGSILAGTSFAERIDKVTTGVKNLFGAVFFISVGMMVDPHIIVEYWSPILTLSLAVIAGMIVFGTFGMLVTGQSLKVAIEAGFCLTQIGEFSFIIATLGMSLGVLDPTIYPIVVAVSVITTFLTPYFIRVASPAYNGLERVLPARVIDLLNRYTQRATNEESHHRGLWKSLGRRYLWRVAVYSMILIAIALVSIKFLLPMLLDFSAEWGRLLCAVVSVVAMSPFLVALMYRTSNRSERDALLKKHAGYSVPLTVMMIFRFTLAWSLLVYDLSAIYSVRAGVMVGLVVFLILLLFLSKKLKVRLNMMESKFLSNLNERELRRNGRENNLINNMHLAYVEVGYGCPFVGERLVDADIRRRYGVNVMSIQRGSEYLPVPSSSTRVYPGDTLGVVGTDEEIQRLLPVVEAAEESPRRGSEINPDNVKLISIELGGDSPLVGKTVADSGLRSKYSALLVSVKRGERYIQAVGDMMFAAGDVVWLVCDKHLEHVLAGNGGK